MHLSSSNVIVTGATSGIGREVAMLLAGKGARVWAFGRSRGALETLASDHDRITAVEGDIGSEADRAALAAAARPVDVLVNNAGIGWSGLVEDMPAQAVRSLFEVNVLGLVDLTQRVLPDMLERRRGHVVNVASVASWVATPPLTVYSSTKFAVQGFSEGLGRELAGRGVVVSTVNPGPVATRFWSRATGEDQPSEELSPEPQMGVAPELVARAVLRSIRRGGLPCYRTVAVPRLAGLARLGAVPGLRWVVDGGSRLVRRSPMAQREG